MIREHEHFDRPERDSRGEREFSGPDREVHDGGDRDAGNDRSNANERPERGLGADRYSKEIDKMQDNFREWMRENGFEAATGSRTRDSLNSSSHRDSPWSLMNEATGHSDPSRELHLIDAQALHRGHEWVDLSVFAMDRGFIVTGMNEKTGHNVGSAHYQGRAIDVRTLGMTNQQVEDLIRDARAAGYKVRDERIRPQGQKVWGGAHVHIEAPRPKSAERINRDRGSATRRDSNRSTLHERSDSRTTMPDMILRTILP